MNVLWLALAIPSIALGAGPSAMELLQRTASTYQALRSYEFRVTVQTIGGPKVSERHFREAGLKPGKHLMEDEVTPGGMPAVCGASVDAFEQIDQNVKAATIAREEKYLVNGKTADVYVVRVSRDRWPEGSLQGVQFAMYRIDKKTFVVHKVSTYFSGGTQVKLYSILKWNEPLPESLFTSKAPGTAQGAPAPAKQQMVGLEAPDFTLKDSSGRAVHLRDLRGRVVIVDFWATWCGPCRALMPELEKMHRKYADKGLVVLGLDVGEDAETVAKFANQQRYTFTLLLDAEPDVSAKYFVTGYPTTFLIDRNGRIVLREVGGGAAAGALRSAVEAALGG